MRLRVLAVLAFLVATAVPSFASDPVVTFTESDVVVEVSPRAIVVAMSLGFTGLNGPNNVVESRTDEDGDGVVAFSRTLFEEFPYVWCFVDVSAGTFSLFDGHGAVVPHEPLPAGTVLRGPSGSYTQLVLPRDFASVLWVRPGYGAWISNGPDQFLWDYDGMVNDLTVSNTADMSSIGVARPVPAGFERGDLLVGYSGYPVSRPFGGSVTPSLDAPVTAGELSFGDRLHKLAVAEDQRGDYNAASILRLGGTEGTVTVRCRTIDVEPWKNGVDYAPLDEVLTFGPGEMVKWVKVAPINNDSYAGVEHPATLELSEPTGGVQIAEPRSWITIFDDELAPTLRISAPASVSEGDADWDLEVAVQLEGKTRVPAAATLVATQRGVVQRVPLAWMPGETEKRVPVRVLADDLANEPMPLRLEVDVQDGSRPPLPNLVSVDVVDDDVPALIVPEGIVTLESEPARITFRLDPSVNRPYRVTFTTSDGTAKAGADYEARSGVVGAEGITINLMAGDGGEEPETFYVDITAVEGAIPTRQRVAITIVDGASLPAVTFADADRKIDEGAGTVGIRFRIARPVLVPITENVQFLGANAVEGRDFVAERSAKVVFEPGEVEATVPLTILDDSVPEGPENVRVFIDRQQAGLVTIVDNDSDSAKPWLSIDDATASEGDGVISFRVRLTKALPADETFTFVAVADSALEQSDFASSWGQRTIPAGATEMFIDIPLVDDGVAEPDERMRVVLAGWSQAEPDDTIAIGTIRDDDAPATRRRAARH